MIQSFLSKYIETKFDEHKLPKRAKSKGLVVTISRETGCDGLPIIEKLVKKLNERKSRIGNVTKWRYVSKEILEKSAKKLHIKPGKLETLLNAQEKSLFDEILLSLSNKNYPNDIKIKKTIKEVIQSASNEGNVIILGRGGIALTQQLKNSLHIRLVAPLEWRINKEAKEFGKSEESAEKHIKISDKLRMDLRDHYFRRKVDNSVYDILFNVSTLKTSEIVNSIYHVIESRGG